MTKSAPKHQDQVKNLILTGVVAGLTFTLLLLAIMPFLAGKDAIEDVLPTYEGVSEQSEAATPSTAPLGCTSWQNIRINECTWEDFQKGVADCTTLNNEIRLNLISKGATNFRYREVDANTYCESITPNTTWKTVKYATQMDIKLSTSYTAGNRKLCGQFLDATGKGGPVCGAVVKYATAKAVIPPTLACNSWTSVRINDCTLAEWNKGTSNAKCNVDSRVPAIARLTPPEGASRYRYKTVKLTDDCLKQNLTGSTWMNLSSATTRTAGANTFEVNTSSVKDGEGLKLCIQYEYSGENSSTSPICGAAIRKPVAAANPALR